MLNVREIVAIEYVDTSVMPFQIVPYDLFMIFKPWFFATAFLYQSMQEKLSLVGSMYTPIYSKRA